MEVSALRLLIKIPTRERRERFFQVLNKAQRNRVLDTTRFLITLDNNDTNSLTGMNTDAARKVLNMWGNLKYVYGDSKNKIHAVNRDMEEEKDFDIILVLSDDMHVVETGYDKIICDHFEKHAPDTDGALWINDGYTEKRLNTIICIGRKRFERFGYLYFPEYRSLCADNEYTEENQKLGNYHYMERPLIIHLHPMNAGQSLMDALYRRNDAHFISDKKLFYYRKKNSFPKTEIKHA